MNKETNLYDKTVRSAKITAVASTALAAAIALVYFFALRFDFDYAIGHFERGSALFYVLVGAIIAAVALPAIVAICSNKKASISALPAPTGAPTFIAVFASAMATFAFVSAIGDVTAHVITTKLALCATFGLIVIALAMIAAVIPKTSTSQIAQIALTLAAVAMALEILAEYFDQTLPLNSPVRYVTMLAEISVMFFFLSEARLAFGTTEVGERETSARATFPFFVFTNNTAAALALGFSAGALMHELIPGGSHASTAQHPPVLRLALYASLGALALVQAYSIGKLSSEYVPLPEDAKNDSDDSASSDSTDNEPDTTDEN